MTVRVAYESLDAAVLSDWISSGRQEDLHLEFKTLTTAPDLSRDDRKNLAKAVSGFANSDGGLVVWGIDCRRSPSGADVAAALSPLVQAPAVLSKLQAHTGEATVPIVDGVEHRLISVDAEAHVIATLVPASQGGPHMAMLGEGRYYKRSGDSFYQMEHFDIADMFGRRARPELQVSLSLGIGSTSSAGVGRRSAELRLVVGVENRGRGLARFPFLGIRTTHPYAVSSYHLMNGKAGLTPLVGHGRAPDWHGFSGGADHTIHPQTTLDVTVITSSISESLKSFPDLRLEYRLAAEHFALTTDEVVVPGQQLLDLARLRMNESFPNG